jgi:predicted permease
MSAAVLSSVLPVCLLILLGAALRRFRFLPDAFFSHLNRLGFWLLLPALLFCAILRAPAAAGGDGLRVGAVLCACAVAVTAAAWLAARLMRLPGGSARALLQAAMRGNLAYTALPVVLYAFGENSRAAAVAAFALAPAIPFYNFWAVLILTAGGQRPEIRGQRSEIGERRAEIGRQAAEVLRNPLILGCLLGLLARAGGIRVPEGVFNALDALGQAALPCALLALGAGLAAGSVRSRFRPALAATALKLLATPAIGYALALAAGIRGELLPVALLLLASPCAVTSYVMADQLGADKELAASAIALSTLLCLPVMAGILLLFR